MKPAAGRAILSHWWRTAQPVLGRISDRLKGFQSPAKAFLARHSHVAPRLWSGMSDTQRFLLLSMLIGLFAGLMVVCFHVAIDFVSWYTLGSPAGGNWIRTVLWPVIGGGIAVFLVRVVFPTAQGSGVNATKSGIYVSDGFVPFSSVAGKFSACAVSIGSGNSLGPEDPALQMGAGVASLLGRIFRLNRETMRMITPVGAAAGIGAAFNTPITAVLFVMEEVLGGWSAGVLGSIVLAAVSAVVVSRWYLGNQPLFSVPAFELTTNSELFIYALLGVLGGLLSVVFVRLVAALKKRALLSPSWTRPLQPLGAGLLVGIGGLVVPQVMGAGYEAIDSALHDRYNWELLGVLCLAKIVFTALCFGSGIPGGMFAPTLFIGAMLGGAIGGLANQYWPLHTSSGNAYVLVGMGTFFAGVFRAPMTSIFMVFEVSASYVIILPVMIANTISYLLARSIQPAPFFDLISHQEGIHLPSPEELRDQPPMRVEDAMETGKILMLDALTVVSVGLDRVRRSGAPECLVHLKGKLWRQVSRQELEEQLGAGKGNRRLEEVFPLEPWPRIYPDMPLDQAMRLFQSRPVLPVLNRLRAQEVMGTLEPAGIYQAYGIQQPETISQQREASEALSARD